MWTEQTKGIYYDYFPDPLLKPKPPPRDYCSKFILACNPQIWTEIYKTQLQAKKKPNSLLRQGPPAAKECNPESKVKAKREKGNNKDAPYDNVAAGVGMENPVGERKTR